MSDAKQLAEETANEIVEVFRNPEQLPAALAQIFIHRKDDSPCRQWSFLNQLLVAMHGHTDARGFRQWKDVGRSVKKGQKSFRILSPCTRTFTTTNDEGKDEKKTVVVGFRATPVFGLNQTEGEDLPIEDEYAEYLEQLPYRNVAESWGLSVETYNGQDFGYLGFYNTKSIGLGVTNQSTWAHELVHAADDKNGSLNMSSKANQCEDEAVAELGGAILLTICGATEAADLGGCWNYIERYSQENDREPIQVIQKVLQRTCEAVALILDTAEQLKPEPAV